MEENRILAIIFLCLPLIVLFYLIFIRKKKLPKATPVKSVAINKSSPSKNVNNPPNSNKTSLGKDQSLSSNPQNEKSTINQLTHKNVETVKNEKITFLEKKTTHISYNLKQEFIQRYAYYYIWDYYPKNRFPDGTITQESITIRKLIWNFKDGFCPEILSNTISDAILKIIPKDQITQWCFCIIPASNPNNTVKRYFSLCNKVASDTGITNGYNLIQNNGAFDTAHLSGNHNRNITSHLRFNTQLHNRNVILFDDITTKGNSFCNTANELISNYGVKEVKGLFLGRTFYNSPQITSLSW